MPDSQDVSCVWDILLAGLGYLRPMQARGPYEKGWAASRSSWLLVPSQRLGANLKGSLKLAEDMEAANGFVDTMICSCADTVSLKNSSRTDRTARLKTYTLRKHVSVHRISAIWNDSRQSKRKRRIHAHSFKTNRIDKLEL